MHTWIDHSESLDALMSRHGDAALMLDTEFMRVDTFHPKLALVQLNLNGEVAVIDPLEIQGLPAFAQQLASPARLTVMHSASEDLEALAPLLPCGLSHLFDTQIAAAMVGLGAGLSYQKLVATITGVELPKAETRSNWLQRPLTAQQLEYAAHDVEYLPALHSELDVRLEGLGRRVWHTEDCARLVERAMYREGDPEPQRGFKNAAHWTRQQQALLRRLLRWRDRAARAADKPRPWVLDDTRSIEFVLHPPINSENLYERSLGLRALRGTLRAELLDEIRRPLAPEELEFAPILPLPGPREKRQLAALKSVVVAKATELGIPEGLLCARRHLETLIADGVWPIALTGWREALLRDALEAKLKH